MFAAHRPTNAHCSFISRQVYTPSIGDLVLNAAALEFVLSIDETMFDALAPRGLATARCAIFSAASIV